MRRALRRRLLSLATGELTATIVFGVALYSIRQRFGVQAVDTFAWLGYSTLALILIQATIYWLVALRRIGMASDRSHNSPARQRGKGLARMIYPANLVLLAIFPLVGTISLLRNTLDWRTGDPWLGLALYLFAVGEFIHYFVFKIVRSDHDRAARSRWHRSRFRREVAR